MTPLFTAPLALAALASLPTLAAIYWLRSRYRRYPVSSLMLWVDQKESREGGTRIHRLQLPFIFFLELLSLALLATAAAGPHLRTAQGFRPLVVVLDDSFSMLAGGEDSARGRAMAAIEEEIGHRTFYSIRFLLAGDAPQVLGEPAHSPGEAFALLKEWKCKAPSAHLEEAMALAAELGGERALLLVVTDHGPPIPPDKGRIQWWSFGRPMPNLAFVNAARTAQDGLERCLLEIANLADEPRVTTLHIETGDPPTELQRSSLSLQPHETRRVILELKEGTPALRARLGEDALELDNRVTLFPTVSKSVRVEVRMRDEVLGRLLHKAVRATKGTVLTAVRPDILITDQEPELPVPAETWLVHFVLEKDAEAYSGPFVLDRAHPLTEGLSLQGVIWGAGKTRDIAGAPVITAGNVPLLTDAESPTSRHELWLRLRPDLSTLQESPNWPILIWNLVQWHASRTPGLSRTNLRLGEEAILTLSTDLETALVTNPDGHSRTMSVLDRRLVIRSEDVGVYEVRAGDSRYVFAANALDREESNLSKCSSGRWGNWLDETSLRLEYQNVAWLLLLVVLGVLTLHGFLIARGAGRKFT